MLEPESSAPVSRRETIDRLRGIMQARPRGMLAGEPVMVMDGFRYLDRDGRRLGWVTMSLLALALFLSFRSVRWVVIAILVVQWTLLLTRASVVWLGLRLSMVSSMLNAIVTVVGVATVVHIIVRFRQARVSGLPPQAALMQTLAVLLVPVFWACATDAAGFLSLRVAQVGPVRDFGLMTALSCLWVLCGVMLVVPGLALCGRFDTDPRRTWGDDRLGRELLRMVHAAARRPRGPLVVLLVLFGISVAGLVRLQIETDFTRNFRRGSPIVESYAFIESHLGGAGVWDVLVPAPATLDVEFVDHVAAFQEALRAITIRDDEGRDVTGLTKVLSLIDGIQAAGVHPLLTHVPPELRARGMTLTMPHFTAALRTQHGNGAQNYVRVMLRAREQRSAREKAQLIAAVRQVTRAHFPAAASGVPAEVTGSYVLLTNLIDSVLRDQWLCFGVAALGVGVMLAVAFRSIVLALVALVPNVLPILIVLGAMGWLDIKVNMGAAMIAAVSMGLSVDGSIHYIMSFLQARRAGLSVRRAMCEVQHTVGRAVVYATVALIVGFLALSGSEFVPTIYFGCLVSLAMLGGLLGNVLVLPLLLLVVVGSPLPGIRVRG
jgi:predicted RND superfamily exporter protein